MRILLSFSFFLRRRHLFNLRRLKLWLFHIHYLFLVKRKIFGPQRTDINTSIDYSFLFLLRFGFFFFSESLL